MTAVPPSDLSNFTPGVPVDFLSPHVIELLRTTGLSIVTFRSHVPEISSADIFVIVGSV